MAGTVTVSYQKHTSLKVAVVTWTSNASGDADAETVELDGQIVKVVINPDGSAAPSANYDITLVDDDSLDIAQGLLVNRHTSNSEEVYLYKELTLGGTATDRGILPIYHTGTVTPTVANAGDTKQGVIKIYYR